ncbi:SIMPL domain-containing protein [Streptomyces sp. NPDC001553]|uniref:SIMPL domain-containing protein n=1 Tax=Streptomyces sp. NPDC001553 TaxID=3154385 RepID=UPI00331EADB9
MTLALGARDGEVALKVTDGDTLPQSIVVVDENGTTVATYTGQLAPQERKSVPAGYTFIQTMQITISDLSSDLAAEVVDKASEAGGDMLFVNSVVFQLAPESRPQPEA